MLLLLLPQHTRSSLCRAFISCGSFSAEQEPFNWVKSLTKDLADNLEHTSAPRLGFISRGEAAC